MARLGTRGFSPANCLSALADSLDATGSGTCGQTTSQTGFWTKYTYDLLNNLTGVTQNAQSGSTQTRTYQYDGLSRMTSEANPETVGSAYSYVYDTDSTCGTYNGDKVKRTDPVGNVTCYTYDALHRVTAVTLQTGSPYLSRTPDKHFVYDTATVNSVTMSNAKGRLAEAYTGASKTTDLGFSYSARGEVADVYQKSPNSSGYYHVSATYWANGLQNTLNANLSPLPNWTYSADGEGRWNAVSASAGQSPVSSTSYNLYSEPTAVSYGSLDSDAFTFDGNTGRMTLYKVNVSSNYIQGALTWNPNGSLYQQVITDQVNTTHSQTCTYVYDDLARLQSVDCGSGHWGQTYSYDAFGNMNRTGFNGGTSFALPYTAATNRINSSGYNYDANGNLTADNGAHTYGWDAEGKLYQLGSNSQAYDALGRRVEQPSTEILYAPSGAKLALMSGQTVSKLFVPLPGGATAVYAGTSLSYYRHPDWLGSSRVATTTARAVYYDGEYSPYGESYNETGTTDRNFTGQNQDLGANDLYDFPNREHNVTQDRWISPDPAGMGAVKPNYPQTWNRYAYVAGNPLKMIDPQGLNAENPDDEDICADPLVDCFVGDETGGGGGGGAMPPDTAPDDPNNPCADEGDDPITGNSFGHLGRVMTESAFGFRISGTRMTRKQSSGCGDPLPPGVQQAFAQIGKNTAPVINPCGIVGWFAAAGTAAVTGLAIESGAINAINTAQFLKTLGSNLSGKYGMFVTQVAAGLEAAVNACGQIP